MKDLQTLIRKTEKMLSTGTTDFATAQKHGICKDPVPFFDNPSIELLTVSDVAKALRISIATARRLKEKRQIPFIKIGGSVRFKKSDIASYIENQRVAAIDQ